MIEIKPATGLTADFEGFVLTANYGSVEVRWPTTAWPAVDPDHGVDGDIEAVVQINGQHGDYIYLNFEQLDALIVQLQYAQMKRKEYLTNAEKDE